MKLKTAVVMLLTAALLCACHSRPPRVNCADHLTPINAPAPVSQERETRP
jgi:hypothetical protein